MARNTGNDLMFGQQGSIFTNTSTQVKAPTDMFICMIQFLSDTTFDELSPVAPKSNQLPTTGICVGDDTNEKGLGGQTAGNETLQEGSGGQIINAGGDSNLTKFPKGMIIYGAWESFTIDTDLDGGVIAYLDHKRRQY
tara:strand:+ start:120 stop:533 length:414 start_codon:yes stop_codon:yes gene_type:complete